MSIKDSKKDFLLSTLIAADAMITSVASAQALKNLAPRVITNGLDLTKLKKASVGVGMGACAGFLLASDFIPTLAQAIDRAFEKDVPATEEVVEENTEETTEEVTEESTEEVIVTEEESEETTEETPEVVVTEEVVEVVEEVVEETTEEIEQFEQVKNLVRTFEISHEDLRYALYNLLAAFESADNEWYYITAVFDTYFTYENWNGSKIYGQAYLKDGDNVSFDGERYNLHKEYLTDAEYAELMSMRSNYASLVQFKQDTENAQLHAQREAVLYDAKYSALAEKDENNEFKNESFAKLVSEMDNYALIDLEKELKSVFADYITNGGQFAYAGETESKPVVNKKTFAASTDKKPSRYGNLFKK